MPRRAPLRSSRPFVLVLPLLLFATIAPAAEPGPPGATAAGTPAGWDAARPGPGELVAREGDRTVPLPLLQMRVDLDVTGILIHGTISQSFRNDRAGVLEATYIFPLPEGAAVNGLEMRIGDRRIVAEVKERAEARRTYEQARDEGRKAALLEQGRPNLFRTSVAAINPGETVEVRLDLVEEATYEDGEYSLAFPLVYTPRYLPPGAAAPFAGTSGEAAPDGLAPLAGIGDQAPDAGAAPLAGLPRASVSVRLRTGMPLAELDSPSHRIAVDRTKDGFAIRPAEGPVAADRDFILRWRIRRSTEPQATLFVEDRDDGRYALAMIVPPATAPGEGLPTQTLFVVDVSSSMDGPSIAQAKRALVAALGKLHPDDTFDLLEFNDGTAAFHDDFLPGDGASVAEAIEWVHALRASGGTEILPALVHGLEMMHGADRRRVPRLIFLTDGAVGNEEEVLREVAARRGEARIHVIGIGAAPNRYLMRKLAAVGRGLCEFLPEGDALGPRLDAFLSRIDRPVMTDLRLEWDGAPPLEAYPSSLPDLHAGEPLFVSLRLGLSHPGLRVVLRGWRGDEPVETVVEVTDGAPTGAGVADRWARAKVEALLDSLREGADEPEVRAAVIEVATAFHLVTPYTSLVAVEQTPTADGAGQQAALAASLGAGGDLPSGGTDGPLRLLVGLALCASAGLLWLPARRLP